MKKIRFIISVIVAKSILLFLNFTKISEGTSVIGRIVLSICPDFLFYANGYIKTKINVTGTNGKTTTSGLITHVIAASGKRVISNEKGANMLSGIVNTVATKINFANKADYSVLESDEAYLSKVYDNFDADYLVITNLFRDQLDRYGELAATKKMIQNAIDKKNNLTLILNADDPLVASFTGGQRAVYYGIESVVYKGEMHPDISKTEETYNCICGRTLNYSNKFFAQQGHYFCTCGYKRPVPKYNAQVIIYDDKSVININGKTYEIPLIGLYNAYNALAAIALLEEIGISDSDKKIENFKVAFGRSEIKYIGKHKTIIQLIKNPIGANEVLKTVDLNSNILIIINDNYADGRDVSWLWDAEFERLKNSANLITVSGTRAEDMALRLKYAGIPSENIVLIKDIKKALYHLKEHSNGNITILPTYTALLKINKIKFIKNKPY